MTTPTPAQAFIEGLNARRRLETRETCPYSEDVSEEEVRDAYAAWQRGWDKAASSAIRAPRYSRAADSVTEAMVRAHSYDR